MLNSVLVVENDSKTVQKLCLCVCRQPMDAEQCLTKLPSTDIALQIAVYYYSLQLASGLQWRGADDKGLSGIYRTSPGCLTTAVVTYISQALSDPGAGTQMSDSVHQMTLRLMHYNSRLIELTQAQALRRLDRG